MRTKRILHGVLFSISLLAISGAARAAGILETYPELAKQLYSERESNIYFGFGLSPLAIVNNKIGFSANIFQVHWIRDPWDVELFSIAFGTAFGQQYGDEQFFLLRTAPKFRILSNISVGPMGGIEFVHFPQVTEKLNKNGLFAPSEAFSSVGAVYGVTVCETFPFGKTNLLKINEMLFKETYSDVGTSNGWNYYFDQSALNSDPGPIAAGTVFLLEVSLLY